MAPLARVSKRATGTGTSPMSSTSMPADGRPAMIARLIIRAARLRSRLTVTREPRGSVDPYAAPTLAANSGTISTFARPLTPVAVKMDLLAWFPHIRLDATVAPGSTSLLGHSFTFGRTTAPSPIVQLSPITAPSNTTVPDFRLTCLPIRAPLRSAPSPMYPFVQITLRSMVARSSTTV